MTTLVEDFLEGLVEKAKNATPEERQRGRRIADNFTYSRMSKEKKNQLRLASMYEHSRQEELKKDYQEGTKKLLKLFHQMQEAEEKGKEVVLQC